MLSLILGAALSAGSAIGGSVADSAQRKKQNEKLDDYQMDLDEWYQREMSTDYLDTSQAKSTLSLIRKNNKQELENMNNTLIRSGLTDEAKIAYGSKINETYSDKVALLAAEDTKYKDKIQNKYWDITEDLTLQRDSLNDISGLGSTISSLGGAVGNQFFELYANESDTNIFKKKN